MKHNEAHFTLCTYFVPWVISETSDTNTFESNAQMHNRINPNFHYKV